MKFISVKGYDNFEDMGFKCGDEVIILINGGEVKHGIMQEDYKYLEVYVGVWEIQEPMTFIMLVLLLS